MYCKFFPYCKHSHHRKKLCIFKFLECKIFRKINRIRNKQKKAKLIEKLNKLKEIYKPMKVLEILMILFRLQYFIRLNWKYYKDIINSDY